MVKLIKKYVSPYKFSVIIAIFCVACEGVIDLLQPTFMADIIDKGIKENSLKNILIYGAIMLGICFLGLAFAATRSIISSKVSQNIGADLRKDIYRQVLSFREDSMDKIGSGSVITRLTNDTSQFMQFTNGMMRIVFKAPLVCIGSIVLSFILSAKLSIVIVGVLVIVSIFMYFSIKISYKRFAEVQKSIDGVNTLAQEYLNGVRLVKSFGKYKEEEEKFEIANSRLEQKSIRSQTVIAYFSPLITFSINIGIVLIFYVGNLLFDTSDVQLGQIAALVSYMAQILTAVIHITNIFNIFVRTRASAKRINVVFDSETEDYTSEGADFEKSGTVSGDLLSFRNVSFAYPEGSGAQALSDISFTIKKGETLAIIGSTGSGKSTIAWLTMRFYETCGGEILYEGKNINEYNLVEYRKKIAIAPQKSAIFSGTVKENIEWGDVGADRENVEKAAEIACAKDFALKMSDGFDSYLKQGGANISGGQKQRINLARAILKNAALLILDDSTSALDATTEAKVRAGLRGLDCATILITQRIGAAIGADKILVLESGKTVGYGKHSDLMRDCDVYKDIYHSQLGTE